MSKKITWGIVGMMLVAGVGVTIGDYRSWQQAELARYGQGWKDLEKPAAKLTQMYQSKLPGIRLRLPEGWEVKENAGGIEVIGMMTVKVTTSDKNLTDLVNEEVSRMRTQGKITGEREYANTEKMDMTVISWTEELPGGRGQMKQKVMGKEGERLVVLEVTVPEEKWGDYEKTFWEIYKNIELI